MISNVLRNGNEDDFRDLIATLQDMMQDGGSDGETAMINILGWDTFKAVNRVKVNRKTLTHGII